MATRPSIATPRRANRTRRRPDVPSALRQTCMLCGGIKRGSCSCTSGLLTSCAKNLSLWTTTRLFTRGPEEICECRGRGIRTGYSPRSGRSCSGGFARPYAVPTDLTPPTHLPSRLVSTNAHGASMMRTTTRVASLRQRVCRVCAGSRVAGTLPSPPSP